MEMSRELPRSFTSAQVAAKQTSFSVSVWQSVAAFVFCECYQLKIDYYHIVDEAKFLGP